MYKQWKQAACKKFSFCRFSVIVVVSLSILISSCFLFALLKKKRFKWRDSALSRPTGSLHKSKWHILHLLHARLPLHLQLSRRLNHFTFNIQINILFTGCFLPTYVIILAPVHYFLKLYHLVIWRRVDL